MNCSERPGVLRATWQYCRYCLAVLPPARALDTRPLSAVPMTATVERRRRPPSFSAGRDRARVAAARCTLARTVRGRVLAQAEAPTPIPGGTRRLGDSLMTRQIEPSG